MRIALFLALVIAFSFVPPASAEARTWEVGANLAYAFPGGSLEDGSPTSDLTFGLTRLRLSAAYRAHRSFSAGIAGGYGLALPKLCGTGGECVASLGSDTSVGLVGRWHIGSWRSFEPDLELELGYEWFTARHADGKATSSRSFHGVEAELEAHGRFRLSRLFWLGPFAGLSGGSFVRAALEAPGVRSSRGSEGTAIHVWPALGVGALASW